jgi:transposase-like protein
MGCSRRRRRTFEERVEVVGRYVESGLTRRVFAREEGIYASTLDRWLGEVSANEDDTAGPATGRGASRGEAGPLTLLEVELAQGSRASGGSSPRYAVELPGGTRLHIGAYQ